MRIMFIADITGRPGRWIVSQLLWGFKRKHEIDFVIANVENAAGGYGVTREISQKLFTYGVDVQTSGNHIWDRKESHDLLDSEEYLLRPANYPPGVPGRGSVIRKSEKGIPVGVLNIQGRVYMKEIDCPFRVAEREIGRLRQEAAIIFVDFHAEATSEKQAMGYYLDGRASALIGTHTHVQTADERIYPKGLAYLTDAGMTGPHDSVLWVRPQDALRRFLTGLPHRFQMAEGDVRMSGVVVDIDESTGKATHIERYKLSYDGSVTVRDYFGLPPREVNEDEPRQVQRDEV
ncbi:MAG: TIGR00282 family metallophosphoesterase [candidate division Zixibacteria bacterium]|nr:TIGR00282 family metallophosphoesterase [candidate division Zixibacteria bacterium]